VIFTSQGAKVGLPKDEMLYGALVGCTRQIDNVWKPNLKNTYDAPPEQAFQFHVLGALGEMAVAKHYDLFWSGALGDYKAHDVGGAQVRTTAKPDGCLIVHARDADSDPFIFVVQDKWNFWLRGWILGKDAKQLRFWRTQGVRTPAFFVPQDALLPIEELQLPWRG